MGLRDWLDRFLGRGSEPAGQEDKSGDFRLDFLRDLRGADAAAVNDYRRLLADEAAAVEEIDDADAYEDEPERFRDLVFMHVCDLHEVATAIDWAEGADTLIDAVDRQLDGFGAAPLDASSRAAIIASVGEKRPRRGEHIGYAFGPLAEQLEQRGFVLLDINEGSDCYHFIVAPQRIGETWAGADLSGGLCLEDPSWQFKKQLTGSPYERFLRA